MEKNLVTIADRAFGSRIGRIEFFTILPSGFFLTIVLIVCCFDINIFKDCGGKVPSNILMLLVYLIRSAEGSVLAYFTLGFFLSHILGSIVLSIPVSLTEKVADLLTFNSDTNKFPYNDHLRKDIKGLKYFKNEIDYIGIEIKNLPELKKEVDLNLYNFWKNILYMKKPECFNFYQNCETKSRFFSCMIWAGIFGILIGAVALIVDQFSPEKGAKLSLLIQVIIGSAIFIIPFAIELHNTRRQEADTLLDLIIGYAQEKAERKEREEARLDRLKNNKQENNNEGGP